MPLCVEGGKIFVPLLLQDESILLVADFFHGITGKYVQTNNDINHETNNIFWKYVCYPSTLVNSY